MSSMDNPVLSICIPTYNRAVFIRETFDALLATIEGWENSIELLVFDNAGSDNTPEVVESYGDKLPMMRYHRNPENIGAELNMLRLAQRARGDYLWLLGDDDKMAPGFLTAVFEALKTSPDLVVCNCSIHSGDFSKVYKPTFHSMLLPERFETRAEVLGCFGISLGFISATIIRRQKFIEVDEAAYKSFARNGLSFFYAVCANLPSRCKTEFIRPPLLYNRSDNTSIADWNSVFIEGVNLVLRELEKHGYPASAVKKAKERAVRDYILPRVTWMKKTGLPSSSLVRHAFSVFGSCRQFWLLVIPAYFCPYFFIRVAKWFVRR